MRTQVTTFFDEATFTATHLLSCSRTGKAALIDPVWDFDQKAGRFSTRQLDQVLAHVSANNLTLEWVLETHVHADHITSAALLRERLGVRVGIGARVVEVQRIFRPVFDVSEAELADGAGFDALLEDGAEIALGDLVIRVMHTPGHTPACVTYVCEDLAFVGDTLFMPDYGTARCDFPAGDARVLYHSIQKILALPDATRLMLCHDYKAPGRDQFVWETTVAAEKAANVHIKAGTSEDDYVAFRTGRDKTLSAPVLILPSVQVNMRGGALPGPHANGTRYLLLPVDRL